MSLTPFKLGIDSDLRTELGESDHAPRIPKAVPSFRLAPASVFSAQTDHAWQKRQNEHGGMSFGVLDFSPVSGFSILMF